jgi:hypothetical protein
MMVAYGEIKGNYEMRLSQYKHLLREVNPHKSKTELEN